MNEEILSLQERLTNLENLIEEDAEERKKQYRVLLALLPKTQEDIRHLLNDVKIQAEKGVVMMLINFQDKLDQMAKISEQDLYTAAEIGKMLEITPMMVGKIAKKLGYKGSSNYTYVSMYRRNGCSFPKEKVFYKEVAIPGIKREARKHISS